MLLIPCPHCGERDESEFDYGGRARALPALNATPQQWHQALHLDSDETDVVKELWFHTAGCERWIEMERNVRSHEFTAVNPRGDEQ